MYKRSLKQTFPSPVCRSLLSRGHHGSKRTSLDRYSLNELKEFLALSGVLAAEFDTLAEKKTDKEASSFPDEVGRPNRRHCVLAPLLITAYRRLRERAP